MNDFQILREYKSDLLTVLIRHEHWLPLSLPLLFDSTDLIQRVQYESTLTETNTSSASTLPTLHLPSLLLVSCTLMDSNLADSTGILARFFNQLFQSPSISEKTDTDRCS